MNFQPLKDFLDFYLPMLGVPGSDTVVYRDGQEVFRYQSGFDSLRMHTPVRPDALYYIYSVTKITTAIAATQLIERGEIVATDPLYAYFPEYRRVGVRHKGKDGSFEIREAKNPILIRHLLTMTSGLNYDLSRDSIARLRERTGGRCPTVDFARAIADDPLEFEPGTKYLYGLSLDVMGALVELVSGQKFGEYCKEHIFDPLGMKDTTFGLPEDRLSRLATQYSYNERNKCAIEIGPFDCPFILGTAFESGGAGLVSTVDDQIRIAEALTHLGKGANGERILSSRAVELMRSNALPAELLPDFAVCQQAGYGYGYGVRSNLDPASVGNLMPKGEFGWDGAKLCYLSACPESGVSFFHAEHMGGLHAVLIPRLRNVIYSCLD